jgi:DNA-binding XRE family transcriptional regulator
MVSDMIAASLGESIRQHRTNKGLKQADLAKKLGIGRTTLIAIEKGDARVKFGSIAKVMAELRLNIQLVPTAAPTFEDLSEIFK